MFPHVMLRLNIELIIRRKKKKNYKSWKNFDEIGCLTFKNVKSINY